MVNTR